MDGTLPTKPPTDQTPKAKQLMYNHLKGKSNSSIHSITKGGKVGLTKTDEGTCLTVQVNLQEDDDNQLRELSSDRSYQE